MIVSLTLPVMMYEDAIIGIFQMKIISNDNLQTVEWCLSCELSVHLKSPSEFHMPFHFIWSQVFSSWRNSSPLVFVLWYLCSTWLCWFLGFFFTRFLSYNQQRAYWASTMRQDYLHTGCAPGLSYLLKGSEVTSLSCL